MSQNEERILNSFLNVLQNTLRNLNVSINDFFGEKTDKISIISFKSGCFKLGYYDSNKNEVDFLISKF